MTTKSRLALAASALWVLPLWVVRFPPMVDYPQQLALAANLLAIPLALGGVAMADGFFERSIERPFGWRPWLALLYLILPELRGGYLIAARVAPFAAMMAVV